MSAELTINCTPLNQSDSLIFSRRLIIIIIGRRKHSSAKIDKIIIRVFDIPICIDRFGNQHPKSISFLIRILSGTSTQDGEEVLIGVYQP